MSGIKIVGIDPGLAGTGIGVIEGNSKEICGYSFGSISTDVKDPIPFRLNRIYSKTLELLCKIQPEYVVIEDIFSLEKYPRSGIILGKVSGVLLLAAYKAGLDVEEIPVREVKKIISGNGSADKFQMERAVRNLLKHKEPIRPFHASDALGLAITGYFRYKRRL
ncbi:MAG: crossover junction endodeoxyribonuclease RuvC [Desulfobacula sp.]|jgi:crossover junction endodeoxyribonuclease RuvC|uniref:crossover junction endodeoxyribonuclease RuvC n=1 Tax=Desulfobacula sp. TaxID=2593537 RepID=UPI001D64F368|nr:crossover junction endodeoxyribonuclease RuvC [Desulfobacula sp.]MBT3485176.1 crossover junction endodeoxyribonuclease RuvC [Desulfobacula sp.]MBT3804079.1 crossover junction endodeoxyribonuclease RuvC [Desulfobacula sp.]MBT4025380.1 crossover junction endodeoxyribonuclease RuvC [Desulfobacula sp.]MBT4199468.1 crossover junction endodeoxyribonuclease RuvC [Desulfobacula sp.]